jgi:hypothetical protein
VRGSRLIAAAVIGVAALLILAWLAGFGLHVYALVAIFVELALVLGFLALATWVVATVWKTVMRR